MEGLIPFIYKAVKERRRRSYSRCSSTGSAGRFGADVQDDFVADQGATPRKAVHGGHQSSSFPAEREMMHRRHRSLEELAGEVGSAPEWRAGGMRRGRSVRIFSCIGGGM